MPADKEYLETFYERSHDSPKGDIAKEEFLANADYFFTCRPFKDEDTLFLGWDNLVAPLVAGIAEELTSRNHPSKPQEIIEMIEKGLAELGKLLSGEAGKGASRSRVSESELAGIVAKLFAERRGFYGGLALPGVISDIRTGLVAKGIQEYIWDEWAERPPGWKNGSICLTPPDDEGWDYQPRFADLIKYEDDRKRGTLRLWWEPYHEASAGSFCGMKFNPHFGDFGFYRVGEILEKIDFTHATTLIFSSDGGCKVVQMDTKVDALVGSPNRFGIKQRTAHSIGALYYQKIATSVLAREEIDTFKEMCRRTELNLAQKRRRRIRRLEMGIKSPRVKPYGIFYSHRAYSNYATCFGNLMSWMVQAGLVEMGEFARKADYFSTSPHWATNIQIALKNMGAYVAARVRWLDPMFLSGPRTARQFLLCGLKVRSTSGVRIRGWKNIAEFHSTNIFLAFEVPTAGAIEIPILGKGMPFYDKEFYKLWQAGKVSGVEVSAQFYSLYQRSHVFAIVPASTPSDMPGKTLSFGNLPPAPKTTILKF